MAYSQFNNLYQVIFFWLDTVCIKHEWHKVSLWLNFVTKKSLMFIHSSVGYQSDTRTTLQTWTCIYWISARLRNICLLPIQFNPTLFVRHFKTTTALRYLTPWLTAVVPLIIHCMWSHSFYNGLLNYLLKGQWTSLSKGEPYASCCAT